MKDLGLFARFKIPQSVFAMFITTIEDGYHDVSYHNRIHAADVVQNVYFLLRTKSFPALLTSDDIFACLLGAAIHDYQHPGNYTSVVLALVQAHKQQFICFINDIHRSKQSIPSSNVE
jgi:hypothetical protein